LCPPSLPLLPLIFSYLQALIHDFLWWWACSWLVFSLKWRLQSPFLLLHFAVIDLQEANDSIDKEDPRPTSCTRSYINFDAKKLYQITNGTALATTTYQATGNAHGSAGFVNIIDLHEKKVKFDIENNVGTLSSTFVKSVEEILYNISVIQISKVLPSTVIEAPAPIPTQQNLTNIMSKHECKVSADALSSQPNMLNTFNDNLDGGLTIFFPLDNAFKAFLPKFENLTKSSKVALLDLPVQSHSQIQQRTLEHSCHWWHQQERLHCSKRQWRCYSENEAHHSEDHRHVDWQTTSCDAMTLYLIMWNFVLSD